MADPSNSAAVASTPSHNDNTNEVSLGTIWDTVKGQFENMGRALTCPICQSTYKDAVVFPCVHAYCRECITDLFRSGHSSCCICKEKVTRRSMVSAPDLNQLAKAFKLALRQFGLAPVEFDPSYNAMTQIAPGDDPQASSSLGLALEPADVSFHASSPKSRRKSNNIRATHVNLLVSKTWKKVLYERQQAEWQAELEEPLVPLSPKVVKFMPSRKPQSKDAIFAKQLEKVAASHERVLIDAIKHKQEPSQSPVIDLSQQHEINIEEGLDQELATRQMEEEQEAWDREEKEREWQRRQEEEEQEEQERLQRQEEEAGEEAATAYGINRATEDPETDANVINPETEDPETDGPTTLMPETDAKPAAKDTPLEGTTSSIAMDCQETDARLTEELTPWDEAAADDAMKYHETDAKPAAADSGTTTTTTQDFFTPREVDSQGTTGTARSLVDMSLVQAAAANNKNTNSSREAPNQHQQPPILSFQTAVQQPSQEGGQPNIRVEQEVTTTNNNNPNDAEDSKLPAISTMDTSNPVYHNDQSMQARTPLQSNTAARIVDNSSHNDSRNAAAFRVGSLVKVQDRTWSGINKPGGIARVTKIVDASSYNVQYILGGREKNVDAVFLSLPPEEMDWYQEPASAKPTNRRDRKSKRISTQVQFKAEGEAALPPDLVEQLAKEGFDVTPIASGNTADRGRRQVRIKVETPAARGGKRSRSESRTRARRAATTAAKERSKSEGSDRPPTNEASNRRGGQQRSKKKPAVLRLQSASKQEEKDQQARNKQQPPAGKTAAKKKSAPKRQKTMVSKRPEMPPPSASTLEMCSLADGHYRQRIQDYLDSSSLCIITSGLSEDDKTALKALCKSLKQNGGVHIKQSEVISPKKTTLCLLPASPSRDNPCNLVAQCRTVKAMKSALHGIPLVASSWIQACRDQNQVVMPKDAMFVRSLPVKTVTGIKGKGFADYGVAKMAVQSSILGSHQVLQNFTAHLCGTFARPPKADVQVLLQEAGAVLSLQTQPTISFLQTMDAGSSLVLICDDTCASIHPSLYRQIETTRKEYKAKEIFVVNPQWLFDSISAGSALPMASYAPAKKNGQPLDLWKVLQS